MSYSDPQKQRDYQRIWKRGRRKKEQKKVFSLMGGKCSDCDNDNYDVLQIDHAEPIKRGDKDKTSGSTLKQSILSGKMSIKKLRLLCANCHQIKTFKDRKKFSSWIE